MEIELANALVEALEELGEEAHVYEGYSGRGMFGKQTTGVVTESSASLLRAAITYPQAFLDVDGEPKFDNISTFREDSMGMDTILY